MEQLRSPFAFFLLAAFLVLSNCPLRNTILDLLKDKPKAEHSSTTHGLRVKPMVCEEIVVRSSSEATFSKEHSERGFVPFIHPVSAYFHAVGFSSLKTHYFPKYHHLYYDSIPLFLKNRILLI